MTDVIRDLPRDDRPRERLLMHGAETLSDAELMAVMLGCGVTGQNAIQLARQLLAEGMDTLQRRETKSLASVRGMGPAKAARIAAMFEFCRRVNSHEPEDPPPLDLRTLGRKLVTTYGRQTQERLGVALLDSRHRMLGQREIYVGTINNALVSTRDIVRFTLLSTATATAVIVYHNHPSGDPTASGDDIEFTQKLQHSLSMIDIALIDHLIIGGHRYHSMQERGELIVTPQRGQACAPQARSPNRRE